MDAASSASVNRVSYGERRRVPREKVSTVTYVKVDDRNGGILLNLGTGGLSLQAVARLDPEQDLVFRFKFFDTGETITAVGRATWLGPTHKNAGVRFKDLPEETERCIANWLARQQSGAPVAKPKPFSPTWQAIEKIQPIAGSVAGSDASVPTVGASAAAFPNARPGAEVQEIRPKPFPVPRSAPESQSVPPAPAAPISDAAATAKSAAPESYRVPSRAILGDAPYRSQPQDAPTSEPILPSLQDVALPTARDAAPATFIASEIAKPEETFAPSSVPPATKPHETSRVSPEPADAGANPPFRPLSLKDILAQQEQSASPGTSPAAVPLEPWRRIIHPDVPEAPHTYAATPPADFTQPRVPQPGASTLFGVAHETAPAKAQAGSAPSARREVVILVALVISMAVGSMIVVKSGMLRRPVRTVSNAQTPQPAPTADAASDPAPVAAPPRVVRRPSQDSWLADIQKFLPGLDDREPLLPSMINVPVKTDQESGYYYCLDSPVPGQPFVTSLEMQGQALQDGYQPKLGAYCR